MKRTTWIAVFGAAMMVLLALLAAGCDNSIGEGGAIDIFYINSHGIKLVPNETRKLTVTANLNNAANKTVTWSSSNPEVATVDENGRVTATKKGGFTTIIAHLGDKEAICPVRVCSHVYPDEGDKCDECGFPKPVLEGGKISYSSVWAYIMYDPVILEKYDGEAAEVNIPEGVMEIGARAFEDCTNLVSVKIPDGVTKFGDYAFQGCTSLESVTIPDSVTSIGDGAFKGCTSLASMTIPASVTSPEYSVFEGCTNLASVVISDGVRSIWPYVFRGCTSLESVTIPDSVTSIGDGAFHGCTSLTNVTIPASVTSIWNSAFDGCTSLTTINYTGTEEDWNAITKGMEWNNNTGYYTITYNYKE